MEVVSCGLQGEAGRYRRPCDPTPPCSAGTGRRSWARHRSCRWRLRRTAARCDAGWISFRQARVFTSRLVDRLPAPHTIVIRYRKLIDAAFRVVSPSSAARSRPPMVLAPTSLRMHGCNEYTDPRSGRRHLQSSGSALRPYRVNEGRVSSFGLPNPYQGVTQAERGWTTRASSTATSNRCRAHCLRSGWRPSMEGRHVILVATVAARPKRCTILS